MSDLVAREAIALIAEYLPVAAADGRNLEARENMLLGQPPGRPGPGQRRSHRRPRPQLPARRGVWNSPTAWPTPSSCLTWPTSTAWAHRPVSPTVAELMGEDIEGLTDREAAKQAGPAIMNLMADLEMPEGLAELNIPEDCFDDLAERALVLERVLENNPRPVTKEDAIMIYEEAY